MSVKIYASQDWVEEKLVDTQSDWDQADPNSPDFVKNKPDILTGDDEALELSAELGFIEPLVGTDGTIYTSPDGYIYTLE